MFKNLWIYVVPGLLAFYALLYLFLDLPTSLAEIAQVNPLRTLLGALATGLITAQALVFTISLVAAQLNARYTHRMVYRVFTWPTGLYMALFIGSSIYSMVVLASLSSLSPDFVIEIPGAEPIHPVTVALALAGTCLVLLIPYLWSFKQRLDPERMTREVGQLTEKRLNRGRDTDESGVAVLDNVIMSAYGYKDYDTFKTGLEELAKVGIAAWRLSNPPMGVAIFQRLAHAGVATIDDFRAPIQVIEVLTAAGSLLVKERMQEASRQAALAIASIGEVAAEQSRTAVIGEVASSLSLLGSQGAEQDLVATAEEAAYSLGRLGEKTCQQGLEDSTRQVTAYLRRVGARTVENGLDLATRQAMVSLWTMGANSCRHLPGCCKVVAGELEMMERMATEDVVDDCYRMVPRSQALEDFHEYYQREIRRSPNGPSVDANGQQPSEEI